MQELKTHSITKGKIAEIFHSLQGEGIYTGLAQVFVRFYGCNLSCRFCDTALNDFQKYSPFELVSIINGYKQKIHSVSLTGGEPLIQKDFLKEVLILLKQKGHTIYLETNGTLPDALSEVIDYVDIVAMDWKLPGSTGLKDFAQEHLDFLKIALEKEVFIKMVIGNSTHIPELERAAVSIAKINKGVSLVLQPNHFQLSDQLTNKLQQCQEVALRHLDDVRIMPQMHKTLKVR